MISVEYILADLPDGDDLDIKEDRGRVVFRIGRHLTPEQIASILTEGARRLLEGGHWFQEWKGDIIAADASDRRVGRHVPPLRSVLHEAGRRPDNAA